MAQSENTLDQLSARFTFKKRPIALPADLRPDWRLAVLVMILRKCCKNGQSTLRRLHVLSWTIRNDAGRSSFLKRLDGGGNPDDVLVRFEPVLNRAVDFARAFGLVNRVSGDRVRLTLAGARLADEVEDTTDLLVQEKNFLNRIRNRVSETAIEQMMKGV